MNNVMITSRIEVGVDELIEHISECFDTEEVLDLVLKLDLNQADYDFTVGLICKLLDSLKKDVPVYAVDTFDTRVEKLINFLEEIT